MNQKLPSCQHGVVGECNSCSLLKASPKEEYLRIHRIDIIAGCPINPDFEIPIKSEV